MAAAQFKSVTGEASINPNGAVLKGWSLRSGGSATVVNIRNGDNDTGDLVAVINLAANTSETRDVSVMFPNGIFLEVTSGSITGSVWFE